MPAVSTPTMASNYTSIRKLQTAPEENAHVIQSYQTNLGHLALVILKTEFLETNGNTPFEELTNPGLTPPDPTEGI